MRRSNSTKRSHPPDWNVLAAPAVIVALIVLVAWWMGPGLFGVQQEAAGTPVQATVTAPAPCSDLDATETVRFEVAGQNRTGTLSACGHRQDETVRITVPANAGEGVIDVRLAETRPGYPEMRRPIGLALLALSGAAGSLYAYLVARGQRRRSILI